MSLVRTLAILPLAAAVVLTATGCKPRGQKASVADQERASQGSSSNMALQARNDELQAQLDQAREELAKNQGGTVGDSAANLGVDGLEGFTSVGGGRIALGEDFAFEKGSATLNKEGKKAIEKLALKLNDGDQAGQSIVVEGHTDDAPVSRPRTVELYTDNWGLSAARSASVVRALQAAGVKAERLRGSFRGQYAPAVTGGKKDDRGANRRVEIYLAK
jgi:flagellar motor protein MotB